MPDYLLDLLGEELVLFQVDASSLQPSGKITGLTFDGMEGVELNVDGSAGQNVLESPVQQFVRARMLDSQAAPELMRQMFGHLRNWLNNRIEDEHSRLLVLVPFGLPDEARVLLQNNLGQPSVFAISGLLFLSCPVKRNPFV